MNVVLIFAGGCGSRMGVAIPKQFLEINGVPILVETILNLQKHNKIDAICLVVLEEYIEYVTKLVKQYNLDKVVSIVPGGKTGQDSIYNGLCQIKKQFPMNSTVLIHDGVRPIIDSDVITENINAVKEYGSAITCKKCTETIITIKNEIAVDNIIDRSNSLTAQAPQSFILEDIFNAHETIRKVNPNYDGIIDSCTLMRVLKNNLHIVMGNDDNLKVTTKKDYLIVKTIIENKNKEIPKDAYLGYEKFVNSGDGK